MWPSHLLIQPPPQICSKSIWLVKKNCDTICAAIYIATQLFEFLTFTLVDNQKSAANVGCHRYLQSRSLYSEKGESSRLFGNKGALLQHSGELAQTWLEKRTWPPPMENFCKKER